MPLLGHLALWVALLAGVWGTAIGFAADRLSRPDLAESARRASVAVGVALVVALMALLVALLRQNFNVAYVTAYSDRALPQVFRWAAVYAGPEGQILLWATLVALAGAAVEARPSFNGAVAAFVSIAVAVLLLAEHPFERLAYTPVDGRGLAPELQNIGFLIAPPLRYLSYAIATVPAALGVSALVTRRAEPRASWWIGLSWTLLTLAIGVEWWWAYRSTGFSSSWVWGPVRNLSLLPWLVLSGLLVWTHRRAWGVRIAAVGSALVVVGLVVQRSATRVEQSLTPGQNATLTSWDGRPFGFTYLAVSRYPVRNVIVTRALIEVRRGTHVIGRIGPEQLQYVDVFGRDRFAPVSRGNGLHRPFADVYAAVLEVSAGDDRAVLRLAINPLMSLVWTGTLLAAAGGLLLLRARTLP